MLRQSKNIVTIEGILNEVDLEIKTDKNDRTYISGKVFFLVQQTINGIEDFDIIPVNVFAYELTKARTINPAFKSAKDLLENYQSVASLGGSQEAIETADRYIVSGASLATNQFTAKDGREVVYPIIRGSFFQKVGVNKTIHPEASFTQEILIKKIEPEIKDDVETGRLLVDGVVIQYGEVPDILTYVVANQEAVDYIQNNWQPEDTVKVSGRIRWSVTEDTIEDDTEVGFGTPEKRIVQKTMREFIITSGSGTYPEESSYNVEEVVAALQKKKNDYEARKRESQSQSQSQGATTRTRGF